MSENLQAAMAIVTGASSGIGEATALRLAEEGARVVLVGRRRGRLDTVAESIETRGGEVVVVEADITDADAAAEVVATAVDRFGRLDVVVNAAGVMLNGPTRCEAPPGRVGARGGDQRARGCCTSDHGGAAAPAARPPRSSTRQVADVVNVCFDRRACRRAHRGAGVYNATKFGVTAVQRVAGARR